MKKLLLAAAVLAMTGTANAGVLVIEDGNSVNYNFPAAAAPGNSVFFNFNSGDGSSLSNFMGFARIGGVLLNGNSALGAEPETFGNPGTQFLSTVGGSSTSISQATRAFDSVSFFLGSIDTFNTVNVLSTSGSVIASFVGSQLAFSANGNQDLPQTNRRVTFTRSAGDGAIGGISFASGTNSLEVENLVFTVPEPSTWAFMTIGFGMIGFAMRSRRRKSSAVVYA